jgi:hypothetical protein
LKTQPVDCKRDIPAWIWLLLIVVWLSFPQIAKAQRPEKKDYIVVADTALSQGKVLGIPSEDNTVVYFSRSRRNAAKAYTVAEVTEFRVSERLFFAKKIPVGGSSVTVFLEKLTQEVPQAKLWKLNGKPSVFYLETASVRYAGSTLPHPIRRRVRPLTPGSDQMPLTLLEPSGHSHWELSVEA